MNNLYPTDAKNILSDEEWGQNIESQFNRTVPANMRADELQRWISQYMQATFDTQNEDESLSLIDPDDVEEIMIGLNELTGLRTQYNDMRSRIAYLFYKHYSIIIDVEEVDFVTLYGLYYILVLKSIEYISRYIKMIYDMQKSIDSNTKTTTESVDASVEKVLSEIGVDIADETGVEHIIDMSHAYSAIESVLSSGDFSFEGYIEKLLVAMPGNIYLEKINSAVNTMLTITVEDPDIFGQRLFTELEDTQVMEAVLRTVPRI